MNERVGAIDSLNSSYTKHYSARNPIMVYPTEFVVRIFLGKYPNLNFENKPSKEDKVLDLGFGDCRNTVFLCQQGFDLRCAELVLEPDLRQQGFCDRESIVSVEKDVDPALSFRNNLGDFACHIALTHNGRDAVTAGSIWRSEPAAKLRGLA